MFFVIGIFPRFTFWELLSIKTDPGQLSYHSYTRQSPSSRISITVSGAPHMDCESPTCRLAQALLTSHITYRTPFVNLKPQETTKLDALIRKMYKSALSLPTYTANKRLLKLGLHNTLSELIEAHRVSTAKTSPHPHRPPGSSQHRLPLPLLASTYSTSPFPLNNSDNRQYPGTCT